MSDEEQAWELEFNVSADPGNGWTRVPRRFNSLAEAGEVATKLVELYGQGASAVAVKFLKVK